jgi:hypothetical protein
MKRSSRRLPAGRVSLRSKPARTGERPQNVADVLRRATRLLPECMNCGDPLAGPDAVARGPDAAWHFQCRECHEFCVGQLELVADQPGGVPVRIYRCRRCGTMRSCRPGWSTRCHVCLDERSIGPAVTDAGYALLSGPARDPGSRHAALVPPTGGQIRRAVEASSLRVLADVLRAAEQPGWELLATDVYGLPWTGRKLCETSHGTWGRHRACGTVARLYPGAVDCPICGPEPGPPGPPSVLNRDDASSPGSVVARPYGHRHRPIIGRLRGPSKQS